MPNKFEAEFLNKVLPLLKTSANVIIPPGDDCAGVKIDGANKILLLASDQIIGNVHYFQNSTPPEKVGAKLLKRNLSDIAAMGGKGLYALVNIANGGCDSDYLYRFMQGINEEAEKYGILIIGGDTGHFVAGSSAQSSSLVASLTIIGEADEEKVACRQNAQDGDLIFITGTVGESLANEHHLNFTPRLQEGQFLTENNFSCCMMDISDGLLLDLKRMCRLSNISAKINLSHLPLRNKELNYKQISCGEDYELLFAVPRERTEILKQTWKSDFAPLTCIGEFIKNNTVEIYDQNNNIITTGDLGYEH